MGTQRILRKDFRKIEIKIALCYPNLFQAGIACYAIQLIYFLFNSFENVQCERFYYSSNNPPQSMESGQPLINFDIVCFSLQYELDYLNMLAMLSSGGISLDSKNRTRPLIIAGGPCALENPLPLVNFIDIFVLGDLEPILDQFISLLIDFKHGRASLQDFSSLPGLFIPRTYQDETITKLTAHNLDRCVHPTHQLTSEESPFGKSLLVEVTRGCPRGCRFCLIGYQALPIRSRSLSTLKEIILDGIEQSNVKKITLIGPSLSDYPQLEELCAFILDQGLNLSLPSIRIEALSDSFLELLKNSGLRTISLAPEAGSSRLRKAIGKEIPEDFLLDRFIACSEAKIDHLKLYFLINLPTETPSDIDSIRDLLTTIIQKAYPPQRLHLSINPFIPKPHTPFQWEPPLSLPTLQKTIKILQNHFKKLKIYNVEFLDPRWARIQGILSRGTSELGPILLKVLQNGKTLGAWRKITKEINFSIEKAQDFPPLLDNTLPWDFIDIKIPKQKLLNLYYKTHS